MNQLRLLGIVLASLATANAARAQEKLFDNNNPQACGYTDTATFELQGSARIERIDVWYRWRGREASVPYTIWHDRQQIRAGMLQRADCDPYQERWCIARDVIDMDAGPGRYMIRTGPRVCQNQASGGAGFVQVFGRPARPAFDRRDDRGEEPRREMAMLPADVWRVEEGIGRRVVWTGTWTRRGRSEVFDAVWRNVDTGQEARDTLRVVEARERIIIRREGNNGQYRGELSRDGRHMNGTASWYSADGFWRADAMDRR